jgi:hypothetical protein
MCNDKFPGHCNSRPRDLVSTMTPARLTLSPSLDRPTQSGLEMEPLPRPGFPHPTTIARAAHLPAPVPGPDVLDVCRG